jgi:predicted metalloprotease with PDZ domain
VIVSLGSRWHVFFFAVLIFGFPVVPTHATIRYHVSLAHPEQHVFHVTMTIPDVAEQVVVQMPAWNALYQIRDFSSHIQRVDATQVAETAGSNGPSTGTDQPAAVEKIDKQTWRISARGTVTVRYAIYWDEPGPFATQLNQEHAFINPAMILMYVPDRRSEEVHFDLPDVPDRWEAAGPGIQGIDMAGSVRTFVSTFPNYDELADAPIEVGKFETFQLEGVTPAIRVVVHGDSYKKKDVETELRRICQYEIKLMKGAPYERYTFILHIGKGAAGAGGGMEHADGTAIFIASGEYLPGVAAHEFFHLWNVKRIRPATLYPVDYAKEQYTRALWFAEGVTNTYGSYTLERSGLWSKQQLYHDLGQQITELESRPANKWQSAEQSSLDAWLEKYPLYENGDDSISYYTKGQVLGDLLDMVIRDRTNNAASLDDVLLAMNANFAVAGKSYRDSLDVRLTVEKVAGVSFEEFFKRYVAGAEALPYRATLQLAGLDLRETTRQRASLGFSIGSAPGSNVVVASVEAKGSPAAAGLQVGDILLKWDGGEPPRHAGEWLARHKAGDVLHLRLRRDESEIAMEFRLGEVSETYYDVAEDPQAGEKARQLREGWLHGVTNAEAKHASR